jgi:hypothetical protein
MLWDKSFLDRSQGAGATGYFRVAPSESRVNTGGCRGCNLWEDLREESPAQAEKLNSVDMAPVTA